MIENYLPSILYPGSFNPLHAAHEWVLDQTNATLEISINRRGKGQMTLDDLRGRLAQIERARPGQLVAISNSLYFKEKIRIFGNASFCLGTDTLRRLIEDDGFANVEAMKCKFLVFQRDNDQLETINLPSNATFFEVPKEIRSISSSEIRFRSRNYSETEMQIAEHEWIDPEEVVDPS